MANDDFVGEPGFSRTPPDKPMNPEPKMPDWFFGNDWYGKLSSEPGGGSTNIPPGVLGGPATGGPDAAGSASARHSLPEARGARATTKKVNK